MRLAASVPLLWIPRLIGALPPIARFGRVVYRRIAGTRTRTGRCTDATCELSQPPLPLLRQSGQAERHLTAGAVLVVIVFVLQQVVVSTLRIESEPFVSDFAMYSYMWPSREEFDRHLVAKTRRYVLAASGVGSDDFDRRIKGIPGAVDVLDEAIDRLSANQPWNADLIADVRNIVDAYAQRHGEPLSWVEVVVRERGFDWERGAFEEPRMTLLGRVDLRTGTLMPADAVSPHVVRATAQP